MYVICPCLSPLVTTSSRGLSVCSYSLPSYSPIASEWYMANSAVICSTTNTLSPLIEKDWLNMTYPMGLVITGYFVANETGLYEFQVFCTHSLRIYMTDTEEPVFAVFHEDSTVYQFIFKKFLESGEQWLRIIHEVNDVTSSFSIWYRLTGTSQWFPFNKAILKQGGVTPSAFSASNAFMLINHTFSGPIPRVSGAECNQFQISPTLPSSILLNNDGSLSGSISVVIIIVSHT